MPVTFQCPSCSRTLVYRSGDESFQICRLCGSKIIVPSTTIHENDLRKPGGVGPSLEALRNLKLAEIQSELNAGRKIEAIKLFRESFKADLSTAKDAVEMMQSGARIPGKALSKVAPEKPVEQKIHTNVPVNQDKGNSSRIATTIFWMIVIFGIAIAVRIFSE